MTSEFIEQLKAAGDSSRDELDSYLTTVQEQADEHFLKEYFTSDVAKERFEQGALDRARRQFMTYCVTTWTGRGPTYCDQSLIDRLNRGELLQRMQDYLDVTYGPGNLRVFNHRLKGNHTKGNALTVSWDVNGFANVDSIIENNRRYAHEIHERHERHEQDDDERDGRYERHDRRTHNSHGRAQSHPSYQGRGNSYGNGYQGRGNGYGNQGRGNGYGNQGRGNGYQGHGNGHGRDDGGRPSQRGRPSSRFSESRHEYA